MNNHSFISIFIIFCIHFSYSQEINDANLEIDSKVFLEDDKVFNPLSPAKAAFYSAVLPGLGQAYNKRYWKIPFVYGALASSVYYYNLNNVAYQRFRAAYKLRSAGKADEFLNIYSDSSLESAQKNAKSNRDTSLLTFIGLYALQILEASVDAHLLQFNVSDNISFNPRLLKEPSTDKNHVGLSLNFKF